MSTTWPRARAATLLAALVACGTGTIEVTGIEPQPADAGVSPDARVPDATVPEVLSRPVPYRAAGDSLHVRVGGAYRPVFIAGVNLGVAVPGTLAGELAATEAQYDRWFQQMGDAGINAVRVYTLHYPRFYRALHDYNRAREAAGRAPMYLFHGIWLDERYPDESDPGNFYSITTPYQGYVREAVDAVHGNTTIDTRFGRAFGTYDADVSPWLMGWIAGREIYAHEVMYTNSQNAGIADHDGDYLAITDASPAEAWMTARLDELIGYELDTYDTERPVSMSSWPTLDPLTHELDAFEDLATIDLADIELRDAPAGVFHSFHVYPYYPDFISETPAYRSTSDAVGPNSYAGYLRALRDHYHGHPVVIAEFGVPSSWGNAHYGHSGMHHGGHDEHDQGLHAARMLANLYETDTAGGMLFAWIDEWWKPTWITNDMDFPASRRAHWHNASAPEQNYGLVAFDPVTPAYTAIVASGGGSFSGSRVAGLEMVADARHLRIRLPLAAPLAAGDELVVGLDTYRDELGESVLPGRAYPAVATTRRHELAVRLYQDAGAWRAELLVTRAYNLFGLWAGQYDPVVQKLASTATDGAPWVLVRWQNNYKDYSSSADTFYGAPGNATQDIGRVRVRDVQAGDRATSLDAVTVATDSVTVMLPWTLLQFVDPGQRRVFHDDPTTVGRETLVSEGVGVSVALNGALEGDSARYTWPTWTAAPDTVERLKPSYTEYRNAITELIGR